MRRSQKKYERNQGLSAIDPKLAMALAPEAGKVAGSIVDNTFQNLRRSQDDVCGKKPFLFGKKRWEKCVQDVNQAELDAQVQQTKALAKAGSVPGSQGQDQSFFQKNKTPLIIGGSVLALGIGYGIYQMTKK